MAAARKDAPATVPNTRYLTPEQQEAARAADSSNTGTSVGQYAPRTYYVDQTGKVSTTEPERGSVLIAQGDVVTEPLAAQLKGAR